MATLSPFTFPRLALMLTVHYYISQIPYHFLDLLETDNSQTCPLAVLRLSQPVNTGRHRKENQYLGETLSFRNRRLSSVYGRQGDTL